MLERALFFRRNRRRGGDALRERLLSALREGAPDRVEGLLRDSATVEGDVVAAAYLFRDGGAKAVSDALDAELARARASLERGMNFLGTLGNNAPFIGLFGTVIGVIVAFEELGSAAAQAGSMGNVMSGIAEALVATGVGLFVAIPAVIGYNIFQQRIGEIEQEAVALGRLVSAALETQAKGGVLRVSLRAAQADTTSSKPGELVLSQEAQRTTTSPATAAAEGE
jgi:biopolymer transport protein ExbB/TolQ